MTLDAGLAFLLRSKCFSEDPPSLHAFSTDLSQSSMLEDRNRSLLAAAAGPLHGLERHRSGTSSCKRANEGTRSR